MDAQGLGRLDIQGIDSIDEGRLPPLRGAGTTDRAKAIRPAEPPASTIRPAGRPPPGPRQGLGSRSVGAGGGLCPWGTGARASPAARRPPRPSSDPWKHCSPFVQDGGLPERMKGTWRYPSVTLRIIEESGLNNLPEGPTSILGFLASFRLDRPETVGNEKKIAPKDSLRTGTHRRMKTAGSPARTWPLLSRLRAATSSTSRPGRRMAWTSRFCSRRSTVRDVEFHRERMWRAAPCLVF